MCQSDIALVKFLKNKKSDPQNSSKNYLKSVREKSGKNMKFHPFLKIFLKQYRPNTLFFKNKIVQSNIALGSFFEKRIFLFYRIRTDEKTVMKSEKKYKSSTFLVILDHLGTVWMLVMSALLYVFLNQSLRQQASLTIF